MMVTHDVGLKDFADRIIWMRDGKIKFVEVTSQAAKQKRLQKLNSEMEVFLQTNDFLTSLLSILFFTL